MKNTPTQFIGQPEAFTEWRLHQISRQPLEPNSRSAENRPTMIKIDAKRAEMSDEKWIAAMMEIMP